MQTCLKGSGRFQNVTLLGRRSRLKHVHLGTSSSRSDDVEWFTGQEGRVSFDEDHMRLDARNLLSGFAMW